MVLKANSTHENSLTSENNQRCKGMKKETLNKLNLQNEKTLSNLTTNIPVSELITKYKANWKDSLIDTFLLLIYGIFAFIIGSQTLNSPILFHLVAVPICALAQVKIFMVFHDCGHNNYSPSKYFNNFLLYLYSPIILTPPSWSYRHHLHHITSGNLGQKEYRFSDTVLHTKEDYQKMNPIIRKIYRIARSPICFTLVLPTLNFWVKNRIPQIWGNKNIYWVYVYHNLSSVALVSVIYYYGYFQLHFEASFFATMIGFMLFHAQHTFNDTPYLKRENWKYHESALYGSTFLQVPFYMKWFMHGIEYHHIHHLSTKIPGYQLEKCHLEYQSYFTMVKKVSMSEFFSHLNLVLYDEKENRFITFDEADNKII